MPVIPYAIGASILALGYYLFRKKPDAAAAVIPPTINIKNAKGITDAAQAASVGAHDNLVPVKLGNDTWLVAADYIGPIGIGEAEALAKTMGMELPTPALVDAIWRQADLKLLPMPRNNVLSEAVFNDQKKKIQDQIADRPFNLLGGSFKDIVVGSDGFPQLYGWHVEDGKTVPGIPLLKPVTAGPGKVIQPLSGHAHGKFYKDYSQGVRLVKKQTAAPV